MGQAQEREGQGKRDKDTNYYISNWIVAQGVP